MKSKLPSNLGEGQKVLFLDQVDLRGTLGPLKGS